MYGHQGFRAWDTSQMGCGTINIPGVWGVEGEDTEAFSRASQAGPFDIILSSSDLKSEALGSDLGHITQNCSGSH